MGGRTNMGGRGGESGSQRKRVHGSQRRGGDKWGQAAHRREAAATGRDRRWMGVAGRARWPRAARGAAVPRSPHGKETPRASSCGEHATRATPLPPRTWREGGRGRRACHWRGPPTHLPGPSTDTQTRGRPSPLEPSVPPAAPSPPSSPTPCPPTPLPAPTPPHPSPTAPTTTSGQQLPERPTTAPSPPRTPPTPSDAQGLADDEAVGSGDARRRQ